MTIFTINMMNIVDEMVEVHLFVIHLVCEHEVR